VTLDKTFYNLLFKQEVVAAPVTAHFLPYSIPRGGLYYKYNYYTRIYCIIIIYNNDDNGVINNSKYGRLQDLILLFRIPMDMRKDFFECCKQFRHASSQSFATPGLRFRDLSDQPTLSNIPEDLTYHLLYSFVREHEMCLCSPYASQPP
jgi:hypothetical protein